MTEHKSLLRILFLFFVPELIHSYTYPMLVSKRYGRTNVMYPSSYNPIPMTQRYPTYQLNEYDDGYAPYVQEEEDYSPYGRYPMVPVYYPDKQNTYGYVEEQPEIDSYDMMQEDGGQTYPYGYEKWFEGSDANADANAAFMQNVMQMYQDGNPFVYAKSIENYPPDDEVEEREWSYGVPITEPEDDENVRELESLRPTVTGKIMRSQDDGRPLAKDEVFRNLRLPKQTNGRKMAVDGIRVSKKQIYNQHDFGKYKIDGKASFSDRKGMIASSTTVAPTTTSTERPAARSGQKEFVLPRPANPVRRPYDDLSRRSVERVSVYDTIKKLLAMDEGLNKNDAPRLQKRFVLKDDQLISELSGLKKIAV